MDDEEYILFLLSELGRPLVRQYMQWCLLETSGEQSWLPVNVESMTAFWLWMESSMAGDVDLTTDRQQDLVNQYLDLMRAQKEVWQASGIDGFREYLEREWGRPVTRDEAWGQIRVSQAKDRASSPKFVGVWLKHEPEE